jgi:heavy metal translocating P-type ATPase
MSTAPIAGMTPADEQSNRPSAAEALASGGSQLERRLVVALSGGMLLLVSWLGNALFGFAENVTQIPAAIGAIIVATPLFAGAVREVRNGQPGGNALASLAVLAAMANNFFLQAGFLAFFLWLAELILSRTAWGAQRAIRELIELTPDEARVVGADGSERQIALAQVQVGMTVRVRPGENLPVDGTVTVGSTSINQASLTGESVPVEAQPGTQVYAGTANITGQVDIAVTAVAGQTTIGKVENLIREAEKSKTARQELIEKLSNYYVPVVLMVAGLVWFFTSKSTDPATRDAAAVRAITVLVVTTPGALLIAYPTAMVAAFAAAARLGIMVKQTSTLEAAGAVDTVVMDKTGTLTTGKFAVSRLVPAEGADGAALLQSAADAEQSSNHPLAKSIMETAVRARLVPATVTGYKEVPGRGVEAATPAGTVYAGRGMWIAELNAGAAAQVKSVEEKLRRNAAETVAELRQLGVRKVVIFTGDRLSVAKRVGEAVGVDAIEAECLPEEKHEELKYLIRRGARTLVVGDGINDGPILASADVGVAMGLSGSDIATNSAGVALMNDDLRSIPFLLELARKAKGIVAVNIGASLLLALVGLALAATGKIDIWITPFYQAAAYVFVIANSLRLVRFGEDFAAAEEMRRTQEAMAVAKPVRAAQKA